MAIKIEKKGPVSTVAGNVTITDSHGGETKSQVKLGKVVEAPVMANVGVRCSRTVNLGDYNSVKIEVSLYIPCPVDEAVIDANYDFVMGWVNGKMEEVTSELKGV